LFETRTKPCESDNSAFKEIAGSAFDFLIKDYGFRLTKFDNDMVMFQTAKVFLSISLGRASRELKVEIGLLPNQYGEAQPKFLLTEIIEFLGERRESEYLYFQGLNKEQLQKHLPLLAELVKKYAKDVLKGDYLVIQNLERLRSDTSVKLHKARIRQSSFD
jgi:hypothetical protein